MFNTKDKPNHREQNLSKHVQAHVRTRAVSVDLHGRAKGAHVLPKETPAKNVESQITSQKCASPNPKQGHINQVQEEAPSSSDDEYLYTMNYDSNAPKIPKVSVKINNVVEMITDTGTTTDILNEATYRNIRQEDSELQPTTKRLFAYGSDSQLIILGKFDSTVTSKTSTRSSLFTLYKEIISGTLRPGAHVTYM